MSAATLPMLNERMRNNTKSRSTILPNRARRRSMTMNKIADTAEMMNATPLGAMFQVQLMPKNDSSPSLGVHQP